MTISYSGTDRKWNNPYEWIFQKAIYCFKDPNLKVSRQANNRTQPFHGNLKRALFQKDKKTVNEVLRWLVWPGTTQVVVTAFLVRIQLSALTPNLGLHLGSYLLPASRSPFTSGLTWSNNGLFLGFCFSVQKHRVTNPWGSQPAY